MTNRTLEAAQHIWDEFVGMTHPLDFAADGQPDESAIEAQIEFANQQGWFANGEIEPDELRKAMRTCIEADLDWQKNQQ